MTRPPHANEVEWRTIVILNVVALRRAVSMVGVIVAAVACGVALEPWWSQGPITVASTVLAGAIAEYLRDRRLFDRLEKLHFEAHYDFGADDD